MNIEAAIALATGAHAGQTDKSGHPYIEHPFRVMERLTDPDERMAAILHDVVEDTRVTLDDLSASGCPGAVVAAVDALTRRDNEAPEAYYARVKSNRIALAVKGADIADNSDPERLAALSPEVADRLRQKYAKARKILWPEEA